MGLSSISPSTTLCNHILSRDQGFSLAKPTWVHSKPEQPTLERTVLQFLEVRDNLVYLESVCTPKSPFYN